MDTQSSAYPNHQPFASFGLARYYQISYHVCHPLPHLARPVLTIEKASLSRSSPLVTVSPFILWSTRVRLLLSLVLDDPHPRIE